jgi:hypothetical protein
MKTYFRHLSLFKALSSFAQNNRQKIKGVVNGKLSQTTLPGGTVQITHKSDNLTERLSPVSVVIFMVITLTAIVLRLYLSFSHDLIFGVDGGYYPVQVRHILNTGWLSFNDVPFYFYFCAFIVKVISVLGFTVTDESIISVIKIVDSVALPLLAIPLFKMITRKDRHIPFFAGLAILFFTVLSFTPFAILGDLQKNAFAIPMVFLLILFIEQYLINPDRQKLTTVAISLAVIALTHFGVFTFCMIFFIVSLFIHYGKKAILPSLITVSVGFALIAVFDSDRALRLITFWNVVFERPALLQDPLPIPLLLNTLFSYLLAFFAIFQLRRYRDKADKVTKHLVLSFIVIIFIFAFPLVDLQYFQRFGILLFIPQSLLILYLIRMNQKSAVPFSVSLVMVTILSIFISFSEDKRPCIDDLAFQDLQNVKKYITEDKENTIIIAPHGLEFWTAWALNVSVVQDRSMDKPGFEKYKNIIFLQQKDEERSGPIGRGPIGKLRIFAGGPPPMGPPMGRPVPENFNLIYSSSYFNAYQKLN